MTIRNESLQEQIDNLTRRVSALTNAKEDTREIIYSDDMGQQKIDILSRSGSLWVEIVPRDGILGDRGSAGHYLNKEKASELVAALNKALAKDTP